MTNVENPKNPKRFECTFCNYITSSKKDYDKHLLTRKHQIRITTKNDEGKIPKIPTRNKVYACDCGKEFKHASSLWNHKQKCIPKQESIEEPSQETSEKQPVTPDMNMFIDLLKQNQEFKEFMMEQSKQIQEMQVNMQETQQENQELQKQLIEAVKVGQHIENQTNINNNNQRFNLNFFLNEQCKDAINMSDFLENMELDLEDLTETGRLGYVGGISRILVNKLQELDVYKRPMHCTDMKRETLYIKENDEWEKQANSKEKMTKIIGQVANKNCRNLPKWAQENPGYEVFDSPENMEYMNMTQAILGGFSEEENRQYRDKIVRNVVKEIMVHK